MDSELKESSEGNGLRLGFWFVATFGLHGFIY